MCTICEQLVSLSATAIMRMCIVHRCMGHLIRFVHNRDLAVENIVTAFTRQQFVCSSPPGVLERLSARLQDVGCLPKNSMIRLSNELVSLKGSLTGVIPMLSPSVCFSSTSGVHPVYILFT